MLDVNEVPHSKKQIVQEINVKIHPQKSDKLYYLKRSEIFNFENNSSYQRVLILKNFLLFH
jgi:hypothetical protein